MTACRIVAAAPVTQSRRVIVTISMIARTPRPSSPTRHPTVPSNSTSLDALDRLPSLSFRRCSRNTLRPPSGSTRGTRKQVGPADVRASTRKTSHIGAEQNHLCPVSRQVPSGASVATVALARTSDPPCFSVIAMPAKRPAFSTRRAEPGS